MIHFQMRFAWDRHLLCTKQSCNRLFLVLVGSVRATLPASRWLGSKVAVAGGGPAQAAGRERRRSRCPSRRASKSPPRPRDSSLPDVSTKKLTAFFAPTERRQQLQPATPKIVSAPPSPEGTQSSCLWHCCLLPFASVHSSSLLPLCSAPVTLCAVVTTTETVCAGIAWRLGS